MDDPADRIAPRDLRVSHAEREHITQLLARHHAAGRLDADEFAERAAAAASAVTRADLNRTVVDLPGVDGLPVREVLELTNTAGEQRRHGEWIVPPRIVVRSWVGSARLDMRKARFVTDEVLIECDLMVGNLELRLPPGASVDLEDVHVSVGSVVDRIGPRAQRGNPHVVVRGRTGIGGVRVR
ncbi:MAG: DUF1707 domain-containing protein [Pseudonocardia sp.]